MSVYVWFQVRCPPLFSLGVALEGHGLCISYSVLYLIEACLDYLGSGQECDSGYSAD